MSYYSADARHVLIMLGILSMISSVILLLFLLLVKTLIWGLPLHIIVDSLCSLYLAFMVWLYVRKLEDAGMERSRAFKIAFIHNTILIIIILAVVYLL